MKELRNALASLDGGNGVGNLVSEDLEPAMIGYLYRVSPLVQLLPKKRAAASTHEYSRRTVIPSAWVESELASQTFQSSTYDRTSVALKITRVAGGVSHFAQAATAEFIDLLETEVEGAMEGVGLTLEYLNVWGDASADSLQYSGLDKTISTDNGGTVIDHDGVATLALLDQMVDAVSQYRGVSRDPKLFIMSSQMISKISGLESRVGMDLDTLEFAGGLRLRSWRGIPMLDAPYVRPTAVSPTVAAAGSTANGSLPAGTYRYKIASVTLEGEQVAGTAASATIASTGKVTLTWTADASAKLYKVYRTGSGEADDDDNYDLLKVVAAKSYTNGVVSGNVGSFVDDGTFTANDDVHPLASGDETIWLVNMNPARGVSMLYLPNQFGTERAESWIKFIPLAKTKSSEDFMIETFTAQQNTQPATSVVARRVSRS